MNKCSIQFNHGSDFKMCFYEEIGGIQWVVQSEYTDEFGENCQRLIEFLLCPLNFLSN